MEPEPAVACDTEPQAPRLAVRDIAARGAAGPTRTARATSTWPQFMRRVTGGARV